MQHRFLLFLFLVPLFSAAQSEDITVQQTITGADTTPPTVPINLSGFALSTSSLQLNWSVSTDNIAVVGYEVWRDGSLVATTAVTSFIDTGLATSTAYSYQVSAFDAIPNTSASSAAAVVSTAAPPTAGASNTARGGLLRAGVVINSLNITPTAHTVAVTFTTDGFVYSRVRVRDPWGNEVVYISNTLRRDHTVLVPNLQSDTQYTIDIDIYRDERFVIDQTERIIQTTTAPDTTAPANVSNLQTVAVTDGVALTWQNPTDTDFAYVRIVRSDRWFPQDAVDGWVIYEGASTRFIDSWTDRPVYYTVFSFDEAGNRSSGAVTFLSTSTASAGSAPMPDMPDEVVDLLPDPPQPVLPLEQSEQSDFSAFITQNERVLELHTRRSVAVSNQLPFRLSVPGSAIPHSVNTIVGSLEHPDPAAGTFHFLLRYDEDRDEYTATIDVLPDRGRYGVQVVWFDFVTATRAVTVGSINVTHPPVVVATPTVPYIGLLVAVLLLVLVMRIILRARVWRTV